MNETTTKALIRQLLIDSTPETLTQLDDQALQESFDAFATLPETFETVVLIGRITGEIERRCVARHGASAPNVEAKASADRLALAMILEIVEPAALAELSGEKLQECFDLIALIPQGATQALLYERMRIEGDRRKVGG